MLHDEMPLASQITLKAFDKWEIDFFGPICTPRRRTSMRYIITVTDYLTRCDEVMFVKDCTTATVEKFLFENIVTIFGYPKILLSDQGTHFVNKVIAELTT